MDRRGFIGSILALSAAPAIVRASSLMPVRQLELAGWSTWGPGNVLLTPSMITREALKVLERNLVMSRSINQKWDDCFAADGFEKQEGLSIVLRRTG